MKATFKTINTICRSILNPLSVWGVLGCGLLLTSCLSEHPKGALEEEGAYKDATSLELATVAPLYNYIGGNSDSQGLQGTYRGVYDLNTFTTDEAMLPTRGGDWYDGGYWQSLYLHRWTASDKPFADTWNYLYKVVMLCNRNIATLTANRNLLTEQRYLTDLAELRALRAMFYFYIMDLWGNVPLVVEATSDVSAAKQVNRTEIFHFIESELLETINYLPAVRSNQLGNNYGRITQPVVHFLLAKLYLNTEVYCPNADAATHNTHFQNCITYCDKLEAAGYHLTDNYADNFAVHNETSEENIFTIPMNKLLYTNQFKNLFRSRHYSHGSALGFDAENGSAATLSTCAIYGYTDATLDSRPSTLDSRLSPLDQIDPRWYINFYADKVFTDDGTPVMLPDGSQLEYQPLAVQLDLTGTPYEKTAGARMHKYAIDYSAYADGNLQENDIVLFRYADALLMRAEAKIRLGLDGSSDVNAVRARVEAKPIDAVTLETILDERLRELMWEGWRRNDLIRFGRFHVAYDQRPQLAGESTAYTTLFPIPSSIIKLNPNGIQQNNGY
ncbi:MAG: RagB/SusD family nutrient uptake outer membrane protein [Prevotella sp.]|nr:RagB/SusD family nutrient uptake outer membrane protein [Prevotella sp.]